MIVKENEKSSFLKYVSWKKEKMDYKRLWSKRRKKKKSSLSLLQRKKIREVEKRGNSGIEKFV